MSTTPEKEVLEFRLQMKEKLKKDYLRQYWNPYRHASLEGGTVFDPAIQRFMSMRACQYDYFKPTKKTAIRGLISILPFFIMYYFVKRDRDHLNHSVSTGQVAYKDRKYKFMV